MTRPIGLTRDFAAECWNCDGSGELDDCFEDTCVCLDPPCCVVICDVCDGKGVLADEVAVEAIGEMEGGSAA